MMGLSARRTLGVVAMSVLAWVVATAASRQLTASATSVSRKIIRPDKVPQTGLPYSPGVLVGNTLYISGTLGREPATARLAPGGIDAETRQSLANIREVLRAAGFDLKDVVLVTAYIADFKDFERFNAVYREFFSENQPARATVQVAALNLGARVELQMVAVKP